MAKKKNQSLTERIAALINRVGEKPEPTFGDIKSELVECLGLAETLQDGAAIRDAEAKVEILETEKSNLKIELEALQTEVEAFRAERKQQQEEERKKEIPDIQFNILKRLPSEHGGVSWKLSEISYVAGIPVDVAEIHIKKLEIPGLIKSEWGHSERVWHRTIAGSELVLAKSLAGEEEERRPKRHKHADLKKDAHEMLLLIARSEEGINDSELAQRCGQDAVFNLSALCNASFVFGETSRRGLRRTLILVNKGAEYLAERGLLLGIL